jgi:hypothetical protein
MVTLQATNDDDAHVSARNHTASQAQIKKTAAAGIKNKT